MSHGPNHIALPALGQHLPRAMASSSTALPVTSACILSALLAGLHLWTHRSILSHIYLLICDSTHLNLCTSKSFIFSLKWAPRSSCPDWALCSPPIHFPEPEISGNPSPLYLSPGPIDGFILILPFLLSLL